MTAQEIQQYFIYHNENLKLLKIGFDNIRDQIKTLYKAKNKNGSFIFSLPDNNPEKLKYRKIEKSLSRLLSGVQVSVAEESLKRLLYENPLFTEGQREYLLQQTALDQRWYATLRIVFSIAYDLVPTGDETCDTVDIGNERENLGDEIVEHYLELRELIKVFLVPNFSIRNKVQHGEWEYSFKAKKITSKIKIDSALFSQEMTDKVNGENIITTTSRYNLVDSFYQMIVSLGRFKSNRFALDSMLTPFEYFYNDYIKKIEFEVNMINNPKLDNFIKDCVDKENRGQQYRLK